MSTLTIVAFKPQGAGVFYPPFLTERRSKSRYPLHFGVRWRIKDLTGEGRTIDLSSDGLLIACQQIASRDEVRTGEDVQMIIDWPVLLDGKIPLQLHASGRVVRKGSADFACTFRRHEFRTMKSGSLPAPPSGADAVYWPLTLD
jgi:hypothetical protein